MPMMCVAGEEVVLAAWLVVELGGGEGRRRGLGAAGGGDRALPAEWVATSSSSSAAARVGIAMRVGVGECGFAGWCDTGCGGRTAACYSASGADCATGCAAGR